MLLRFATSPPRWVTVTIRTPHDDMLDLERAAGEQLAGLTDKDCEILFRSSHLSEERLGLEATVERAVGNSRREVAGLRGGTLVHCPACGTRIGPVRDILPYVGACRGCGRRISAWSSGARLAVEAQDER